MIDYSKRRIEIVQSGGPWTWTGPRIDKVNKKSLIKLF